MREADEKDYYTFHAGHGSWSGIDGDILRFIFRKWRLVVLLIIIMIFKNYYYAVVFLVYSMRPPAAE